MFFNKIKPKLKNNAYLTCSIPNVRYFRTYYKYVFSKDWEYEESGVMDKTHLRWFTQKSLHRTIEKNGFEVLKIKGINSPQLIKHKIMLGTYNLNTLGYNSDIQYPQFAVKAKAR